jgi:hypothetical protein
LLDFRELFGAEGYSSVNAIVFYGYYRHSDGLLMSSLLRLVLLKLFCERVLPKSFKELHLVRQSRIRARRRLLLAWRGSIGGRVTHVESITLMEL